MTQETTNSGNQFFTFQRILIGLAIVLAFAVIYFLVKKNINTSNLDDFNITVESNKHYHQHPGRLFLKKNIEIEDLVIKPDIGISIEQEGQIFVFWIEKEFKSKGKIEVSFTTIEDEPKRYIGFINLKKKVIPKPKKVAPPVVIPVDTQIIDTFITTDSTVLETVVPDSMKKPIPDLQDSIIAE